MHETATFEPKRAICLPTRNGIHWIRAGAPHATNVVQTKCTKLSATTITTCTIPFVTQDNGKLQFISQVVF